MQQLPRAILLIFFFLSILSHSALAAKDDAIDEEVKEIANNVIVGIYRDILSQKEKFKELADFDENVLYENKYGIYALVYKYEKTKNDKVVDFYEFAITVLKTDDNMFTDKAPYAFNVAFPMAGLKFVGYYKRDLRRRQYDLTEAINRHGFYLDQYQQKFMPLRLFLRPIKDVYLVDEAVQFTVELKNVSLNHMWVKPLDGRSLYCLFNNKVWGTSSSRGYRGGSKTKVLKAGESLVHGFVGESISKPSDVPIFCTYSLSIDGVQPSGLLRVKVAKEAELPTRELAPVRK